MLVVTTAGPLKYYATMLTTRPPANICISFRSA